MKILRHALTAAPMAALAAIVAVVWFLGMPKASAYVGPRPTVEQVKIFELETYAVNLESKVNTWLAGEGEKVRVVDRKFIVTDRGTYAIAIFYEKLPKQSTSSKPSAEATK